jgi:hypothetical protein
VHALEIVATSYTSILAPIVGMTVRLKQIGQVSSCLQPKERDVRRTLPLSMEGKSTLNQKNLKSTECS